MVFTRHFFYPGLEKFKSLVEEGFPGSDIVNPFRIHLPIEEILPRNAVLLQLALYIPFHWLQKRDAAEELVFTRRRDSCAGTSI